MWFSCCAKAGVRANVALEIVEAWIRRRSTWRISRRDWIGNYCTAGAKLVLRTEGASLASDSFTCPRDPRIALAPAVIASPQKVTPPKVRAINAHISMRELIPRSNNGERATPDPWCPRRSSHPRPSRPTSLPIRRDWPWSCHVVLCKTPYLPRECVMLTECQLFYRMRHDGPVLLGWRHPWEH